MLDVIINIIVFLIVLTIVVVIHELGHFLAARRAGILCHEFSIGMGKTIWSKKIGETVYSIKAIPIGGSVAMAGEEIEDKLVKEGMNIRVVLENKVVTKIVLDENTEVYKDYKLFEVESVDLSGEGAKPLHINDYVVARDAMYVLNDKKEIQIAPHDRNFNSKSLLDRFLAVFCGPFMNIVLAYFVFVFIGVIVGFANTDSSVVGTVSDTMPASAYLEVDDEITHIEGIEVSSFDSAIVELDKYIYEETVSVTVLRDGSNYTYDIPQQIYIYTIGITSDLDSEGVVLGPVSEGLVSYEAGLRTGDTINQIDGVDITTWTDVITAVMSNEAGEVMVINVTRETGTTLNVTIEPYNHDLIMSQGLSPVDTMIGIGPSYYHSFFESIMYGFTGVKSSAMAIVTTFDLLFNNDQVSVGDLSGPVGIAVITSRYLEQGFVALLGWVGLLSVNLAVINLLPLPALDGGRIIFLGIEAITRKKVPPRVENTLHFIVFVLLMGFFLYITFNDILKFF